MPIDPSIALQVKPLQLESPLNMLSQALQLQGLQRQNQLGDYQLQEAQANASERAALRNYLARPEVNLDTAEGQRGLYGIAPTQAPTILKGRLDLKKTQADIDKSGAEKSKFNMDTATKAMESSRTQLAGVNTPEDAALWVKANYADPALAPIVTRLGTPEQMIARIPTDPAGFQRWKQENALGASKFIELNKPNVQVRSTGATTDVLSIPGMGGPAAVVSSVKNTISPDAALQATTSRANNAATIKKDLTVAGLNPDGTPAEGGGGLLNEQSIINAASRYNIDGTLPPNIGRGAQGVRQTAQILNEAARQAAERGDTPWAQRIAQIANKANTAALSKLETQQTMVGAFEKNFAKNADIAQELSARVDRTGIPLVNKWINAGKRSITGDADLSAFDASVKATVNEFSKIVSGGSGGSATAQGEISKIEGLLSTAQTPAQVKAVLDLMRRETANRMQAFEDQKSELKAGMVGQPKPATSGQPAAPAGWKYLGTAGGK